MTVRSSCLFLVFGLVACADAPAHLDHDFRLLPATATLRVGTDTYQVHPGAPHAVYVFVREGAPGNEAVLLRVEGGAARLEAFPARATVPTRALAAVNVTLETALELFAEALFAKHWQARGDAVYLETAPAPSRVEGVMCWERAAAAGTHDAGLTSKLARAYTLLLLEPKLPSSARTHLGPAVLSLEDTKDEQHALGRAAALVLGGCYPLAARELQRAGEGSDARSMRVVLRALGVSGFEPVPGPAQQGRFSLTTWRCTATPRQEALPRYETCVVARGEKGEVRTYSLQRQQLSGQVRYLVYVSSTVLVERTLLLAQARAPNLEDLHRCVAADLDARAAPAPAAASAPPSPAPTPGEATLKLIWSHARAGMRFELRGATLLASAWAEDGGAGRVEWKGVPAGALRLDVREPDGRRAVSRLVELERDRTITVDLDDLLGRGR